MGRLAVIGVIALLTPLAFGALLAGLHALQALTQP